MKRLLSLILLIGCGAVAYIYINEGMRGIENIPRQASELVQSLGIGTFRDTQQVVAEKCVTAEGEVIYGEVPEGTRCERHASVEGSLTVVPSHVITSVNSPVSISDATVDVNTPNQPVTAESGNDKIVRCSAISRCSQMSSCAEATFFAEKCIDLTLDDADRVSCMKQWCETQ